jgi:hypothetical protein
MRDRSVGPVPQAGPSSIHVMSVSSGSGDWLELDYGKGAVGLSLHLVVGGVRPDEGRPAAVTLVRGEDPGEIGIGLTASLYGGAGVGREVAEPERLGGGTAVTGDDEPALALGNANDRSGVRLSA